MKNFNFFTMLIIVTGLISSGCSKTAEDATTSTEDSSTGGSAASSIGGAISASDSSGTLSLNQAPNSIWSLLLQPAYASTTCPKITTANGSGCTNGGTYVDLTYSSCSFGTSLATWTGLMEVSLSSGGISCGTFPTSLSSQSIKRQFVSTATVPGTGSRTTSSGTAVTIDHQTADLANFDNQPITANIGTGYGTTVTFDGAGARSNVTVRQRVYVTGGHDHSVDGSINLSESGTTRTANGTVKVYHNKAKVVGTSTFTNVVYNNTSCVPVSGSISTAFAAGTNVSPTVVGTALVGKTETLTFNSDGTATLVDYSGTSSTVTLSHCY